MLIYEGLYEGQKLMSLIKPAVTKVQLVKYAGASGDFNPLHTDDAFAKEIGMQGVIAHGMLVMGFLGEYVMKLAGDTAVPSNFRMRFGAVTIPGDQITCSAFVNNVYEEKGQRFVRLDLIAEKEPEQVVGSGQVVLQFQ
ncbi:MULTISPECIES: MaoC/PaaZ C-terminal domain-containing protein [Peribacillus]|uniref:MaoC/PaaZ C-terminal domain-containing protein n=1 Tax=Peribacillus TaxID=2675229 RepID=UPI001912AEE3|nr:MULTISPECIES: MaoC/PaaZ C-terminal domain-containing protein [unclassified Peribacillus]MBK5441844.1 MaoC family dehydratase N-terminal domain-containing protein [Peribacillus sp. TH24]MBK5463377.1 MaoC family dehydratase N-terminal domain-containing protein [Peribacillus sp. TH27]MBK5483270.1 MaoC family dehydratase N-terminal domain-containing protein [Peribacillus sp. TH16]MBK5501623.1 MaoC family dehydratase N-terminal domain-containing protein [Peribacillus sp. TH14]